MASKPGDVASVDSIVGVVFNYYSRLGRTAAGVGKARQGPGSKLNSLTLDAFIKFVNECQGWRSGGTWLDVSSITRVFAAHKNTSMGATRGNTATMGLVGFRNALPVLAAVAFPGEPPAAALERFGLDRLKAELAERGLKCGGTLAQRAERLWLLRDKTLEEVDEKHRAPKKKKE